MNAIRINVKSLGNEAKHERIYGGMKSSLSAYLQHVKWSQERSHGIYEGIKSTLAAYLQHVDCSQKNSSDKSQASTTNFEVDGTAFCRSAGRRCTGRKGRAVECLGDILEGLETA